MTVQTNNLDLIDDYLSGRLPEDQLDEFETQLLFDEALQAEVATQKALKDGLATETQALLRVEPPTMLMRVDTAVRSRVWAYAASVMVLVGTVSLLQPDSHPEAGISQLDLVYVERVRSAEAPDVQLASGRSYLLSIDAIEFENSMVQVELLGAEATSGFSAHGLSPADDGVLNLSIPALSAGEYQLKLVSGATQTTYKVIVQE